MNTITKNLKLDNGSEIHYSDAFLEDSKRDLLQLLEEDESITKIDFSNAALTLIPTKPTSKISKSLENLERAYKYILTKKEINKDNLKELYELLSNGLLNDYSIENMGEYYRSKGVYIIKNGNYSKLITGVDQNEVDNYMNDLLEYINSSNLGNEYEKYLKSQIIQYYLIYVHPFFDINKRTARTTALWYLLNEKNLPALMFNKGIYFSKKGYNQTVLSGREDGDITLFLDYSLKSLKTQLIKEGIIADIETSLDIKLAGEERETLEFFLSTNGIITAKDLISTYKHFNSSETPLKIVSDHIIPLIDKKILLRGPESNSKITNNQSNFFLSLNEDLLDKGKRKELKR